MGLLSVTKIGHCFIVVVVIIIVTNNLTRFYEVWALKTLVQREKTQFVDEASSFTSVFS